MLLSALFPALLYTLPVSGPASSMHKDPRQAVLSALSALEKDHPAYAHLERGEMEVIPLEPGAGQLVRFSQKHLGLPVLFADAVFRVDGKGRVVRLFMDVLPPQRLPPHKEVVLTPEQARAIVHKERGLSAFATSGYKVELVWSLADRHLCYLVRGLDLAKMENALYLVDAKEGVLRERIDLLRYRDQFRVYLPNPTVARSTLTTVSLPPEPGFSPKASMPRRLESALLKGQNCVDEKTTRQVMGFDVHLCAYRQSAEADGSGDYTSLAPLVDGDDGKCPTAADANVNAFAEASMYYHAARIYDRFRSLYAGLSRPDFKLRVSMGADPKPLPLLVNLCTPNFGDVGSLGDVNKPLLPFENAFFSPGGQGGFNEVLTGQDTDAIAFGMGRRTNFALDGDVIYHEFTHAVIWTRQKLMLSIYEDDLGPNVDPGAMNEGLADYFSSIVAGDSQIGEYAWKNFSTAPGGLRNLDNKDRCETNRIGQIHEDSKAFSGALWAARRQIAGEPGSASAKHDAFDRAVLASLDGLSSRPTMTEAAKLMVQEVSMRTAQLGQDAGKKVEAAFTEHGILPLCNRVIAVKEGSEAEKPLLCIDGIEGRGSRKIYPGHVQWRLVVPKDKDTLRVELISAQGGCNSGPSALGSQPPAPKLRLALRKADEPIGWERDQGTQDELIDLTRSGSSWEGKVEGVSGVVHAMIVNSGGGVLGRDIRLTFTCENPMGCKVPEPPPKEDPEMPKMGCSCQLGASSASSSSSSWVLLAGVFSLFGAWAFRRKETL